MKRFCSTVLAMILINVLQAQHQGGFQRTMVSLNERWDFYPILTKEGKLHSEPKDIPTLELFQHKLLVPGSWANGSSTKGNQSGIDMLLNEWRLFDNYNNPDEWDQTNTAWYHRSFNIDEKSNSKDYYLNFAGVTREAYYYLNGVQIGHSINGTLPNEWEITNVVKESNNELFVYVTDYKRDAKDKAFTPYGADQVMIQKGIYQDVFLTTRSKVCISDVTIRTSTRKNELEVIYVISNSSKKAVSVTPQVSVLMNNSSVISFQGTKAILRSGEKDTVTINQKWTSYLTWSPKTPNLYYLKTDLVDNMGHVLDEQRERFGFREVWVDGHNIMLNGSPVHLFGEWGHKLSLDNFRPEYIRQWYGMLKDCNMNYMRTHTFPHPKLYMDLADEMGIMISLESGWFFGSGFASDKEELWENSMQHVRDIVKTYKNHPSVILYSVGNEVRESGNIQAIIKNMPKLRNLYESLDSTRIPYHEGDSPLWNENEQHLMSRHYGLECTGEGWWDKSKPLHIGEVGKWHYGQPIDNYIFGNDETFASFENTHRAIALEAADMAEQARANEVACFFPWNLSCLDNYRPSSLEKKFTWNEPAAPYIKPLRSGPYNSEFAWWNPESKGYLPGVSFEIMKHAFRPFAMVVRERLNRVFDDVPIQHTITLVNDEKSDIRGTLLVNYFIDNKSVWTSKIDTTVAPGHTVKINYSIPPIAVSQFQNGRIESKFSNKAEIFDQQVRSIQISSAKEKSTKPKIVELAVYGDGTFSQMLRTTGLKVVEVENFATLSVSKNPLLLIEKNQIKAGSLQNKMLEEYVGSGGKVLLLEQNASVMPDVSLDFKPVEVCHIAGGSSDVLEKFTADDFRYWGTDPYGAPNSNAYVTEIPYYKPSKGNTKVLLYSGYGDFGHGGFYMAPLIKTTNGKGILVACQLKVSDKCMSHPTAHKLGIELLNYLSTWKCQNNKSVSLLGQSSKADMAPYAISTSTLIESNIMVCKGSEMNESLSNKEKIISKVKEGAQLLVYGVEENAQTFLAKHFDIDVELVDLGPIYNLIRVEQDPLLDGITNQETCWIDRMQYTEVGKKNRIITSRLLRAKNGKSLLKSEDESCWREFFLEKACNETLRMPTITHFLWNGPRESASGFMKFSYGKGEIILSQIPVLKEPYTKADQIWSSLFDNLGVASTNSLFYGERVSSNSAKSKGTPLVLSYIENPNEKLLKDMMSYANPKLNAWMTRNKAMISLPWKEISAKDGIAEFSENTNKLALFYELHPGRPRKVRFDETTGLPDPTQQTLVDITGSGNMKMYINGQELEARDFDASGKVKYSDISLENQWNTILIIWQPATEKKIGMFWRNRQNQAEKEFEFIVGLKE